MLPFSSISVAFITGLTSGGFSCAAIQGGLLSSSLSKIPQKGLGLAAFLGSKLIAYVVLGAILGALGGTLQISLQTQAFLQIGAGLYMLASAANLLELHPIFRYTVITPPRFIYRFIKSTTKTESVFTPALLGAFTVFLPCGVTQGMMILALSSGSALSGAGILGAFIIGTMPQFIALGIAFGTMMSNTIFKTAASLAVVYVGLVAINTGQILRGSPHTFQNYVYVIRQSEPTGQLAEVLNGVQEVKAEVSTHGYKMSSNVLKAGVPVQLRLVSEKAEGCARAFSIPSLGISMLLPETGEKTITFTPSKKGLLTYSCNMGMYTGSFQVI